MNEKEKRAHDFKGWNVYLALYIQSSHFSPTTANEINKSIKSIHLGDASEVLK